VTEEGTSRKAAKPPRRQQKGKEKAGLVSSDPGSLLDLVFFPLSCLSLRLGGFA
jgi:hypothetical protein